MSLKNINKLFLLIVLLLFSCKPIEVLKEKKNVNFEYNEVKEDFTYIDLNPTSSLNLNFVDYYSVRNSFEYLSNAKINKLYTFSLNKNNKLGLKPLITIIKNEKIYSLDYESKFNIYDLNNFQSLQSVKIMSKFKSNLVWIDLEMTGLDPSKDVIIEIGSAITDWNLNLIAEGPQIVIGQPEALLTGMDEWNQKTHSASGLLEEIRKSTVSVTVAEKETFNFISKYVKKRESPLCGNSIHTDRV